MRIASIDIGSNTILLLIASVDMDTLTVVPLYQDYKMPRISTALLSTGKISNDKIEDLCDILSEYKKIAAGYGCEKIIACGTKPFRIANNADEIINKANRVTGINIKPLTGAEEADYSWLGAFSAIQTRKTKLLLDIGGGSTEVIFGSDHSINYSGSFDIGAVYLRERFFCSDPPLPGEIYEAGQRIKEMFENIKLNPEEEIYPVAVAGTPTSLVFMINNMKDYDEKFIEGYFLSASEINRMLGITSRLSAPELREKYGSILDGRADIITAGILILSKFLEHTGLNGVYVSGRGLRFGVVINFLKNKSEW